MTKLDEANRLRSEARAIEARAAALEAKANSGNDCGCEIAKTVAGSVARTVAIGVISTAFGVPIIGG